MPSASKSTAAKPERPIWYPFRYVHARPRLSVSATVFVALAIALAWLGMKPASALLLGFDVGAILYLSALSRMFAHYDSDQMPRQAGRQAPGRRLTLFLAVVVSLVVLIALTTELRAAQHGGIVAIGVAAISVVLSWLFMNTCFALHYAHGYYGDHGHLHRGLNFPAVSKPDYWDFLYFSFVIGMCFQTSDVNISTRGMRHLTLLHSVVAFFFNVFILAISVSVVGGLAG